MMGSTSKLSIPQFIPYSYFKPRISKIFKTIKQVVLQNFFLMHTNLTVTKKFLLH